MITVENLRKVYGETVAVDGLSFEVPEGEVLGFLGPNGAGKSTTMRILTGFTPATSGSARIAGFDVTRESRQVRALLGYLPESAPVYEEMTVAGYVGFFAELKGYLGSARKKAVGRALEECGLSHVAGRMLCNLSKGYRQRAAIAQAVVGDPRVVILDEPTVGLDPAQVREIRELISGMTRERTVILSTHILPEVSLTCTRVLIIRQGRVVASGTPEHVESTIERPNRLTLVARGPKPQLRDVLDKVPAVTGIEITRETEDEVECDMTVAADQDIRAEVARALVQGGLDLLEMRSAGLTLEDVFIHTVTSDVEPGEETA